MKLTDKITKRWQRPVGSEEPSATEVVEGILLLLKSSSGNMGTFLDFVRNQGSLGLDNLRNGTFHGGFMPNLYQFGENHDLGYVVLPGAKILDRSFDTEAVVVHVSCGEDIFYISLSLDEQGGIKCQTGWKKDPARREWPQKVQPLQNMKAKIVAVIGLLADLLVRQSGV